MFVIIAFDHVCVCMHCYELSLQVCDLHLLLYDGRGLHMHARVYCGHGRVAGSTVAYTDGIFQVLVCFTVVADAATALQGSVPSTLASGHPGGKAKVSLSCLGSSSRLVVMLAQG